MIQIEQKGTKTTPSEGELFISEYLKYNKIEFKRDLKITNLKDDNKKHREPDFYLPKFKTFLEFNGMWNVSDEQKSRYREKKYVYNKNKIPCIYLYPENLGIIDFVFTNRLIEELKKHNLKKQLLRLQVKRLIDDRGNLFLILLLCFFLLTGSFNWEEDGGLLTFIYATMVYQFYRLADGINRFYIKNEIQF